MKAAAKSVGRVPSVEKIPERGPGSRQPRRRKVPARSAQRTAHGVLWSRPGYLVRRLNQVHYALFFEECGDARMTPVQYGLLSALRKKPRGLDQKEL